MKHLQTLHSVRRLAPTSLCRAGPIPAFTIVELLVVLAIVGLLSALLLPALGRGRDSARTARCTGNLRQFGLAAQMYWDDNDGGSFPYRGAGTNNGDIYWFGWLERGGEGARRLDPTRGSLWPYLNGRGVETCPALQACGPGFKAKAVGGACGYGYNLSLSTSADQSPVRISSVRHPAQLAVFADAAQVNDFQAPASPANPMVEEFYYVNTNEPTAHFRHRARAETVFAEGHVRGERMRPGSLDSRLPGARIGRLQDEILTFP